MEIGTPIFCYLIPESGVQKIYLLNLCKRQFFAEHTEWIPAKLDGTQTGSRAMPKTQNNTRPNNCHQFRKTGTAYTVTLAGERKTDEHYVI